ncbi:hypothetical protein SAMN05421823_102772 [Catalinimonas alkaloidigena]|uniref:Uncharacterized protein n=1 Tax=Catalinimonas alkaloidigena TaxID=1075417 RepID=A0A1G9C1A6_9BACT|nr:hypothetical protein [Catalinimonas alkaloidigena]SDK45467.1 hypothetical protein SAMN05421823_102772 [Catalinimonas alkaloidigena]
MHATLRLFLALVALTLCFNADATTEKLLKTGKFNPKRDLLLVQFDCKTDVDDLHSAAAFVTLMSDPAFSNLNYHAVAGTYGTQEGLYVPPNALFQLAFGDHWTDAHENFAGAVDAVKALVKSTLAQKGDVWIAEAGQSDFTAALLKAIQADLPTLPTSQRIHVVQHSDWNEEVTSPESLQFVKTNADYQKIPDGNVVGNGTPGFRSAEFTQWKTHMSDRRLVTIWQRTLDTANQYNGKEGRYLNEAVAAGGLDFSDLSEVCWILGLQDIKDVAHFFNRYAS